MNVSFFFFLYLKNLHELTTQFADFVCLLRESTSRKIAIIFFLVHFAKLSSSLYVTTIDIMKFNQFSSFMECARFLRYSYINF
jgi:hypothetical protein